MAGGGFRSRAVAVLAAAVVVVGLPAVAYAAGGTVTGRVADAAGEPLADVCVQVDDAEFGGRDDVASARTAADGTYELAVAAGWYHLMFRDCGGRDLVATYWPGVHQEAAADDVEVRDGAAATGIDAVLQQGGAVTGRVTDTSGAPLAGTRAVLTLPGGGMPYPLDAPSLRTGADGRYTAHGVPPGRYRATFHPDDRAYASVYYGDVGDAASAAEVVVAAGETTEGVDARLPRGAAVSGVARDQSGAAYAGLCVSAATSGAANAETLYFGVGTAADGSYTLTRLVPGTYRVRFTDCGHVTAATWYPGVSTYDEAGTVTVTEGAAVTGADTTVERGLHIAGRVLGTDGAPLAGIGVAVYDARTGSYTGRNVGTLADGTYVVPNVRGTSYKLHFYGAVDGVDLVGRWWPGVPSQELAVPVSLAAGVSLDHIDIVLPRGGQLRGTVTGTDGRPTDQVCVTADNPLTGYSASTAPAADGTYVLHGLDTGAYRVLFTSCGSVNAAPAYYGGTDDPKTARLVTVAVEQVVTGVNHRATPGGLLAGRVTDAAGTPLAGMCVSAVRFGPSTTLPGAAATDADGRYVIHSAAPHPDYHVSARDCANRPARYVETWNGGAEDISSAPDVAVSAGRTTAVGTIKLPVGGSFSGTVTDQFGKPLYGVCLNAVSGDLARGATHTGQDGAYVIGGLRPGTYTAVFTDCGAGLVRRATYYGGASSLDGAVTFAGRADADTPGVDIELAVVTAPGIPGGVLGVAGDGSASLSWRAPASTGGAPLTAFEVRSSSGAVVATVGGSARSAVVRGLANGTAYGFTVRAVNRVSAGDPSPVVSVVPRPAARLSMSVPSVLVSSASGVVSGRLTTPSGAAVGGARVELLGRRRGSTAGMTRYLVTSTSTTGAYRFAISPAVPMEYAVRFGGSSQLSQVKVVRVVAVSPRISWSLSGRSVSVAVTPAGGGGRARLQVRRSWGWESVVGADVVLGRATLRAPSAGTHRVVVLRSGWSTATGPPFTVR